MTDSSVGKESACNAGNLRLILGSGRFPWRRDRLPTPVFLGFPSGSAGKESTYNAGDLGSIPGLGRSPGEGKGCPLRYSGLENSMNCIAHGVTKSRTRLSNFHFHYIPGNRHILLSFDGSNDNLPATRETWVRSLGWEYPLEKGKATHSSILAWRIPWTA